MNTEKSGFYSQTSLAGVCSCTLSPLLRRRHSPLACLPQIFLVEAENHSHTPVCSSAFQQHKNFILWRKNAQNTTSGGHKNFSKNFLQNAKKGLQFPYLCCIIVEHEFEKRVKNAPFQRIADCTICDEAGGCGSWSRFFRGVCPISNRAKEYCVQWLAIRLYCACPTGKCGRNLRLVAGHCVQDAVTDPELAPRKPGFFMEKGETPGSVYGFASPANQKYKEAFLSGSQRKNPYPHQRL